MNQWYRLKDNDDGDYAKIVKDFYSHTRAKTFYKIVSYYDAEVLYSGKTLVQAREIMKFITYRKGV